MDTRRTASYSDRYHTKISNMHRNGILSLVIFGIISLIVPIYISSKIDLEVYYSVILVLVTFSGYYFLTKVLIKYYFKPSDKRVFKDSPYSYLNGCLYYINSKGDFNNYEEFEKDIRGNIPSSDKYGLYTGYVSKSSKDLKDFVTSNRDKNYGELLLSYKISYILYMVDEQGYNDEEYDKILDKYSKSVEKLYDELSGYEYSSLRMLTQYQLMLYQLLEGIEQDIKGYIRSKNRM